MNQELAGFGRFAEPSLYILLSLADGPKHGYAIMADGAYISGVPPGPGPPYGALASLVQPALIGAHQRGQRRRARAVRGEMPPKHRPCPRPRCTRQLTPWRLNTLKDKSPNAVKRRGPVL